MLGQGAPGGLPLPEWGAPGGVAWVTAEARDSLGATAEGLPQVL